jgi:cytosylglucuronate decarboxylase
MAKKYLFIRILEACNAGCFMCRFAHSQDEGRYTVKDLQGLLPAAKALGVEFLRYTGGEPLIHEEIDELVKAPADAGFQVSLITNGYYLAPKAEKLGECGLNQTVVSIDGASPATHDRYRRTEGLFNRAIDGLRKCRQLGIALRVNTVVGPHNYQEMVELQKILEDEGVNQWELSALKLDTKKIHYRDPASVLAVGKIIYEGSSKLKPMGVPWYGRSETHQQEYFEKGIPPRPSGPNCHVTRDVIYLDGKTNQLFACSCLPHRVQVKDFQAQYSPGQILGENFKNQRQWYYERGPRVCTGCSATAAEYGDIAAAGRSLGDWAY